ncbi:MAG: hypothetical protein ACTHYC_08730 [Sphingobacterium sp.]
MLSIIHGNFVRQTEASTILRMLATQEAATAAHSDSHTAGHPSRDGHPAHRSVLPPLNEVLDIG